MRVMSKIHQNETGSYFFQAYGTQIVYDPKYESVLYYMGEDSKRDITAFFPERPTIDEFERSARRYVAGVI
jgi:hypothetical protein